jgi:hypothetical protein
MVTHRKLAMQWYTALIVSQNFLSSNCLLKQRKRTAKTGLFSTAKRLYYALNEKLSLSKDLDYRLSRRSSLICTCSCNRPSCLFKKKSCCTQHLPSGRKRDSNYFLVKVKHEKRITSVYDRKKLNRMKNECAHGTN